MTKFYTELYSIIILFQLLSLAPISLNNSRIRIVFIQILTIVSFLIIFITFLSAVFINGFVRQNSIQGISGGLVFIAILIAHLIIIIQSYVTRRKQLQMIENISEIDNKLRQKLGTYCKSQQSYKRKVFTTFFVLMSTLIMAITLLALRNINYLFILQFVYPLIVIRVRCIQIIFYVDVLHDRLRIISDILRHFLNCEREMRHGAIKTIYYYVTDNEGTVRRINRLEYVELLTLKQIYSLVWDTSCLLNDCFGWSLLVICIQYFLRLTANSFWLYILFTNELTSDEQHDAMCDNLTIVIIMWLLCNGCIKCTQSVGF